MKIINLTKHTVNIYNEYGDEVLAVSPSGQEARIKTRAKKVMESNDGIPFFHTEVLGQPFLVDENGNEDPNFPETQKNVIYVVSGIFRASYNRHDMWQPGRLIRNSAGQPIGCIGLSR